MHWKRVEDFGRFWKGQLGENWTLNETVDFRLLAETFVAGAARDVGGGADGKAIIERMCISLPFVETFKLKGNKRFRTWTEKSFFRISGFLCSMYICNERPMYILHIHVYGYGTQWKTSLLWYTRSSESFFKEKWTEISRKREFRFWFWFGFMAYQPL